MSADTAAVRRFAPAKVNLSLAVTGRRDDGYHLVDSIVAFADVGDTLVARAADTLSLEATGPFARDLGPAEANLALRAADLLAAEAGIAPGVRIRLTKRLPVAAGVGGGSADAAAALIALNELWGTGLDAAALARLGLRLGADVPMCLVGRAARVGGVGDEVVPIEEFAPVAAVLANPGIAVSTREVFDIFARGRHGRAPADARPTERSGPSWLAGPGNDLEPAACAVAPVIEEVLTDLRGLPGARLARMSGSGATCFAVFAARAAAERAAADLARRRPDWWIVATTLG